MGSLCLISVYGITAIPRVTAELKPVSVTLSMHIHTFVSLSVCVKGRPAAVLIGTVCGSLVLSLSLRVMMCGRVSRTAVLCFNDELREAQ